MESGSFDTAIEGCSYVFHTASPFILKFDDPQRDLIDPALKGTQNILEAVNASNTVERVVLTSSCVAIYGDADECASAPNKCSTKYLEYDIVSFPPALFLLQNTCREGSLEMADAQDRWSLVVKSFIGFGAHSIWNVTSASHDICLVDEMGP